jgi:hypothetical protein
LNARDIVGAGFRGFGESRLSASPMPNPYFAKAAETHHEFSLVLLGGLFARALMRMTYIAMRIIYVDV